MMIKTSNYEKYKTKNIIVQRLIDSFFQKLKSKLQTIEYKSLLDAGCGEGETISRINEFLPKHVEGFDINPLCVSFSQERHKNHHFTSQDIYSLPWSDNEFDIVLCIEVLEHLEYPERALSELLRVSRKGLIISVPHEPWFLLGNLFRGKYIKTWGNQPEHIQHWNPKSLKCLIEQYASILSLERAFPWIIVFCTKYEQ